MGKKPGRGTATLLPGWYDVLSRGTRAEDHAAQAAAVTTALEGGQLLEYEVVDPEQNNQGVARLAHVKSARTTELGTFCVGAHVAASDKNFGRYMSNQEEDAVVYHRCASWPCSSTSQSGEVLHLPKFRVLTVAQARNLQYGKDGIRQFCDDLEVFPHFDFSQVADHSQKAKHDNSASDGEELAPTELRGQAATPKADPAARVWANALRPDSQPDQVSVDAALARRLADGDAAAAAARGGQTALLGGLGLKQAGATPADPGVRVGNLDAETALAEAALAAGRLPPVSGPGAVVTPGTGSGSAMAALAPASTPKASASPGVNLQNQLFWNFQREKLAATHGDSVLTDHSRRILSFYFDQVLKPSLPRNFPVHTERELRTMTARNDTSGAQGAAQDSAERLARTPQGERLWSRPRWRCGASVRGWTGGPSGHRVRSVESARLVHRQKRARRVCSASHLAALQAGRFVVQSVRGRRLRA